MAPELRSENLLLGAVSTSDAERIFGYCQDDGIRRWVPIPQPYSLQHAEEFVTEYAARVERSESGVLWAIRVDDTLAGVIELTGEPVRSATVGFWLGRPWRGRNLMTETLLTVVEYGFDPRGLGLDRIHWESVAGNIASATVARRAGFTFEGMPRRSLVHRNKRVDSWQGSLLATDSREPRHGWPL